MTTIAWDGKTLAADSLVTRGFTQVDMMNKIITGMNDGLIFALCGDRSDYERISLWIELKVESLKEARDTYPIKDEDSEILMITKAGVFHYEGDCKGHTSKINHKFAIGSGYQFALAAMDHGKTAVEAVEYAMTRDTSTGGKVNYFHAKDLK